MCRESRQDRHRFPSCSPQSSSAQSQELEAALLDVNARVADINEMLVDNPTEWEKFVPSARSAMAILDRVEFFRNHTRLREQLGLLTILQEFAFHDADNGRISTISDWVELKWLRILREYPEHKDILTGLGRHWLQRAQPCLATIHEDEDSNSSSQSSSSSLVMAQRLSTGPYVEARGHLQASTDFYSRAVTAADRSGSASGSLLASAAEAYMSLGNVTSTPQNQDYFGRAVQFLRRASDIPGYQLNSYHRQYLEEYGRYVT